MTTAPANRDVHPVAVSYAREGPVAVVVGQNPPVNALSRQVRQGLLDALSNAGDDPRVRAIIIRCDGRTFFPGADIAELDTGIERPELIDVVRATERLDMPLVAAMHGTVFGGGIVIATACDYRIAESTTRFAMPEVELGLLPTYGGTQYLPRLIGVERSLDLIIEGKTLDAEEARTCGLIDEVVTPGQLATRAAELASRPLDKRRVRDMPVSPPFDDRVVKRFDDLRRSQAVRHPGFDAPQICLDVMQDGLQLPIDEAMTKEHRAFLRLLVSAQATRLRMLFFGRRELKKTTFDLRAVQEDLRAAGASSAALVAFLRRLRRDGVTLGDAALEALTVDTLGLPPYLASPLWPSLTLSARDRIRDS